MKKYLIETVSMFRIRYVVEAETEEHACDEFLWLEKNKETFKEFSQKHIAENITSVWQLDTDSEYLELFDVDNEYLKSWTDEQKFDFINKVQYKE